MNRSADLVTATRAHAGTPTLPSPPQTIEELGLPRSLVNDLVLRFAREQGTVSLSMLVKALKFTYPVVDAIFQSLRQQQLVEVKSTDRK